MSRGKRTPIDYTPQYSEGIFRPKEVVEDELQSTGIAASETSLPDEARVHARTHTRTRKSSSQAEDALVEDLYRTLQQKQRLASSTFRFRPQELEELDAITNEMTSSSAGKLSKNDIVRLALNWLLSDYREHGEQSMLGRVLRRT